MKDPAHHPKHIQKKVLKEARQTAQEEKKSSSRKENFREKRSSNRKNPEYEGERFDPHHRKPRLLKRINYH